MDNQNIILSFETLPYSLVSMRVRSRGESYLGLCWFDDLDEERDLESDLFLFLFFLS